MPDELPDSLRYYFTDQTVRKAVDSLVPQLGGENMPEVTWEEFQNYNQALLMAAQVRADYIELLARIWDGTFGKAGAAGLGEVRYDQIDIYNIWRNKCLYQFTYCEDNENSYDLCVYTTDKSLALKIWRYTDDNYVPFDYEEFDLSHWGIQLDRYYDLNYATTNPVQINEFVENPTDTVEMLHKAAQEMVGFLQNT